VSEAERPPGIFDARLRFWLLSGVLTGMVLVALAILVLTQTRWGHERVLGFTLRAASQQLSGTLTVQRLEGNLLTGARLYGVSLVGPDDEHFLSADSAFLEYSLRTIVGDEIVLDRIVLFEADVLLRRLPGDTLWNFDRIFGDTIARAEPGPPRRPLVIRSASVERGRALVELPWEPDPEASPAEREHETRTALADTARIMVRAVPGGYLRAYRFEQVSTDVLRLVSAPDELGGTSLRVDRFQGLAHIFRDPARIRHAEGDLAYREGRLRFQAPRIELPSSRAAAEGTLLFGEEDQLRMDIAIRGDTLTFADLRWLYPPLPEEGGGSLSLAIESRPEGTLYLARDLRVTAPGTRLKGSFGVIINDGLRFVDVDLVADPLRVATIERLLPTGLPVVGLHIGGVEIRQSPS
jgi:hypothetical protein